MLSCRKPVQPQSDDDINDWYSGGKQTVFVTGSGAFSRPFNDLTEVKAAMHSLGDRGFGAVFNSDPDQLYYGLGPVFNNVSCVSCHIGDGRGKAPLTGETLSSLLIRLSTGNDASNGPQPALLFGGQLQQRSILGAQPEADVGVSYTENTYQFPDGESYSLRQPVYALNSPYASLPGGLMISARMATPVFGLGLLEAISEADVLGHADEFDSNSDGISGKPNYGYNVMEKRMQLGRFGWKAAQPTILQQSAGAFNQDMGITSMIFPDENCVGQAQYNQVAKPGYKEVADSMLFAVGYYIKTLAVPGRRNANDVTVKQGKTLFKQINCSGCHVPMFTTQTDMASTETSNQVIFPYTDLLLHDMGAGLADNRPDYSANGQEWRTSPLWGIGLTQIVNGHNNFLHDGRARNFTEAIMWHGGEAANSVNAYKNLSKPERDAILKFLGSL
ncbi:MAG: di-heme oxidoreductase family protein [Bacteroidia bacterium]